MSVLNSITGLGNVLSGLMHTITTTTTYKPGDYLRRRMDSLDALKYQPQVIRNPADNLFDDYQSLEKMYTPKFVPDYAPDVKLFPPMFFGYVIDGKYLNYAPGLHSLRYDLQQWWNDEKVLDIDIDYDVKINKDDFDYVSRVATNIGDLPYDYPTGDPIVHVRLINSILKRKGNKYTRKELDKMTKGEIWDLSKRIGFGNLKKAWEKK